MECRIDIRCGCLPGSWRGFRGVGNMTHFAVGLVIVLVVGAEAARLDETEPVPIALCDDEEDSRNEEARQVKAGANLTDMNMNCLNLSMAMSRSNETTKNCLVNKMIKLSSLETTNAAAIQHWRSVVQDYPQVINDVPVQKLALLFLVSGHWPMEGIWANWLQYVDPARFVVKIHSWTGTFKSKYSVFLNSVLPWTVPGLWCSIVPIMLAMVRAVIADIRITRFVFFCESTIPVKPFNYVYDTLTRNRGNEVSVMCADMDWVRGMPFSYVWSRRDAMLFTEHEREVTDMFTSFNGLCDAEDFFVIALGEAEMEFFTGCVTWSAWVQEKGFATVTNGQHFDKLMKDPGTVLHAKSDCAHPHTIRAIGEKVLMDLWRDRSFFFARKFTGPEIGRVVRGNGVHVRLDQFLADLFYPPVPESNATPGMVMIPTA